MPKLLIAAAAKYFQDNDNLAITKNFLYQGCRCGRLPFAKIGNRYIIDTDLIEKFINAQMDLSIQQKEPVCYGQLRRIAE